MLDWTSYIGKVFTGDCMTLMAAMPDGCVDAVITDASFPSRADVGGGPGRFAGWMCVMPRITNLALVKWSVPGLVEIAGAVPVGWKWRHTLVWHKPMTHGRIWASSLYPHWEPVVILGINGKRNGARNASDFLSCVPCMKGMAEDVGHPTQMPERVARWLIEDWTQPSDLILDPFLGSGTLAVVAERLGRRWIGCEISPEYAEMATKRILRAREQLALPIEPQPAPGIFKHPTLDLDTEGVPG